ncbi:MAG: hypothetical protein A3C08_00920 [Candidatus Taylorbacteria bacterium RIFCSPHIGHO2_02_FULL_47_18]|uniref:Small ribosomal subunit protein bS6 n=1 Tax=Candidatus Taylorbacteria bacterium RIFCSPLOWO2_01_FULL_48_100 TaxID=1802322 RepID=A0A1G2NET5_9BACT|nr:MAG: hypothetical protein A2670_03035 [Candidatus Taylorbacteria bacterium RIFCSPHIGHO2_01_FULL_48_38]OHA27531.1 MAG: hypothetical protein A3C08_00920 [Candidatus Taylorbacteria bacterium RIFCSPHIGHO2_02_FULL_47_18]OHA34595.1 MAG: hypothetical protein A2938_03540 [Candidatus Taylorbacteria bacterium RIFCSPLOWO2_01_FULL_48_100]OHA40358.1 MAG: hypothetical protein A3J31_02015 [Candidatus Taylorbacteria bacterium RIFCSPLOWO2_02_FULL_48_16]OHA45217.1 MAG: hypothetical protein A3H13_02480 [Candid
MSENKIIDPEIVRLYEISYLVSPALAEDKAPAALLPLKDLLAGKNVVVSAEESPKFRRLAYPIRVAAHGEKKQVFDSASFGWIRFESDADTIFEANKLLASSADIIRFLIVKAEKAVPVKPFQSYRTRPEREVPISVSEKGTIGEEDKKPHVSQEELDRKIDELVGA